MPRVTAAPGLRVPREDDPRQYIAGQPVDVPDTSYYRRRLAAGELLPVDVQPAAADAAPTKRNKA